MIDSPTVEFMLSLIRKSYRNTMSEFGYTVFVNRLWRELDEMGIPDLGKVSEQERYVYGGLSYNYAEVHTSFTGHLAINPCG